MAQPDDEFKIHIPKAEDVLQKMVSAAPGSETEHAAMQARADKLTAFIDQQKQDRGGKDIITLVTPNDEQSPAKALEERGQRALMLDPEAVKLALTSDQEMRKYMGITGHEFQHFANKDGESDRKAEYRADLGGAGPLGTKDPEGIIDYLKDNVMKRVAGPYNAQHPDAQIDPEHLGKKEMKAVSDWLDKVVPSHPAPLDRIAALELEDGMMKEGPRKGESPTDQSKRIIDAVMKRVDEGTLPEPSIMKAPEGLSPDALGKISGMAPLPMQEVSEHRAAYSPAATKDSGLKLG